MNDVFSKKYDLLISSHCGKSLSETTRGIEKESLRVNTKKRIAKTKHPAGLGSSLTHPFITTDYSEALLEFITPPSFSLEKTLKDLKELHQYTYRFLSEEVLWSGSMPCLLGPLEEDIPIAEYGNSNLGLLKKTYRKGLGYRYGRKMQAIAGVHYNFSLPIAFWQKYRTLLNNTQEMPIFISEQYLNIARNTLRLSWFLPLLFGASPTIDGSFFTDPPLDLTLQNNTWVGNYATSLRLSDFGYYNKSEKMSISYNSLSEFIQSMQLAVQTKIPAYEKIGVKVLDEYRQLNDTFLQVENEHYHLIRVKRVTSPGQRMLKAIMNEGIEYLEVRAIDNDPFSPIGIRPETIYLMDSFLLMCLLLDSPPLLEPENIVNRENFLEVAKKGRQPGLLLKKGNETIALKTWFLAVIECLERAAALLDTAYQSKDFTMACQVAKNQFLGNDLLSAKIEAELAKGHSYLDFAWGWSLKHRDYFIKNPLDSARMDYYHILAVNSLAEQKTYEENQMVPFDVYLRQYLA